MIYIMSDVRESLIKQIKDVGAELIDRAEEMVNSDMITDFSITADFICDGQSIPVPNITWSTSVITKNSLCRLNNLKV